MASSALDRMIAQSRQITEDLMAVRREAKAPVRANALRDARRRAEDRLYLVLNSLHSLTDEVHEVWREAAGLDEPKQERIRAVQAALDNGQLKLISGDR